MSVTYCAGMQEVGLGIPQDLKIAIANGKVDFFCESYERYYDDSPALVQEVPLLIVNNILIFFTTSLLMIF